MFSIDDSSTILLSAGDHFSLPLFINFGTEDKPKRYKLRMGDTVYFAVYEQHQSFEHALIRKIFTRSNLNKYGDVNIALEPTDTKYVIKGQYYYMIKIKLANGNIETIVPKKKFIIM